MRWRPVLVSAMSALVLQTGVAAAAPPDDGTTAQRVLDLTNTERRKGGLGSLRLSPQLSTAAQRYTEVLASGSCFAHTCGPVPDLSSASN